MCKIANFSTSSKLITKSNTFHLLPLQKQLSLQESEEPPSYPTTTSLPRQSTIGTSGVTASSSVRSKSAQSNHTPSPASSATNGHSKSVSPVSNASNNNSKSKTKGKSTVPVHTTLLSNFNVFYFSTVRFLQLQLRLQTRPLHHAHQPVGAVMNVGPY